MGPVEEGATKRPAGRPKLPKRILREIRMTLSRDDHEAIVRAAKRDGKTITGWVSDAAQDALLSEEEKRFGTRLRIVEFSADRAAKGTASLEKRVGDLYALAQSIERKAIDREQDASKEMAARLVAIEAQTSALVASAEITGTHLSTALILLGCLLRGGTPESRKAYREVVSRGLSVGQILQAIAKGSD